MYAVETMKDIQSGNQHVLKTYLFNLEKRLGTAGSIFIIKVHKVYQLNIIYTALLLEDLTWLSSFEKSQFEYIDHNARLSIDVKK